MIKNKSFIFGALSGLLIIGILHKFTADFSQVTEECMFRQLFGFPFLQFEKCEGDISFTHIYWLGMFGNILFAIVFSFLVGLVFKFVWSKLASQKLR